ncbi:MAG: pitrilysin family protein [Candidatus Omnitrophota bacterium]
MLRRAAVVFISIIFVLLVFSISSHAQIVATRRHVLDNGLTVLVSEMPSSSTVSVYGLVKTGSAREGEFLGAGLSHFMEHMLFKGTARRGVGEISNEIQSLGGTINASTHFDFTIYTLTVPKEHFDKAADILADMLMHARFDQTELEREIEVVLSEIRMYLDRPERMLSNMVFETVYIRHPYRIPVIGYEDLLKSLTREDFLTYYRREYVPNNMIIAIAGNVTDAKALAAIQNLFKAYPRGPYLPDAVPEEPDQLFARQQVRYYPTDVVRMSVSYPGVSIHEEDMPALDALADILGSGQSSRLYRSLRERLKLVHSVSASDFTPQDPGLFEIEATFEQDNAEEIIKAIDDEIAALIQDGVRPEELEKVVNNSLKSLFLTELEPWGVAYRTAVDEAVAGKHDFTKWYVGALQRLTPEDIVRAAEKYLNSGKRNVALLKPQSMKPAESAAEMAGETKNKIEKIVLINGLTVLLREDHSVPMVWLNLVFNGGLYAEPEELNGLSSLMTRVWPKGSKRFSKEEIARQTEQKAVSFSTFTGNQSMGFRMDFMKKDMDFSMGLLYDAVTNPLFSTDVIQDEQKRIYTEINARNDDIDEIASIALHERLFAGHPFGMTLLGTRESVSRIGREDVFKFYQRYAAPGNSVLAVFGDFDREELLKKIKASFGKWNAESLPLETHDVRPITEKVTSVVFDEKEQAMVMTGFQAAGFYDADRYGLELMAAILGYPFKGRMFTRIREARGLAYTLGGGYAPMRDSGEIIFQVLTQPSSAEEVRTLLSSLILDLQKEQISQQELDDMKAYLIGRFQRSIETNGGLSFSSALDELYGLGYDYHERYIEEIRAVTVDDIQRLANQYLSLEQAVEVTVLPDSFKNPAGSPAVSGQE